MFSLVKSLSSILFLVTCHLKSSNEGYKGYYAILINFELKWKNSDFSEVSLDMDPGCAESLSPSVFEMQLIELHWAAAICKILVTRDFCLLCVSEILIAGQNKTKQKNLIWFVKYHFEKVIKSLWLKAVTKIDT